MKNEGVTVNEVDIPAFENAARLQVPKDFPEWTPNLYTDTQAKMASMK